MRLVNTMKDTLHNARALLYVEKVLYVHNEILYLNSYFELNLGDYWLNALIQFYFTPVLFIFLGQRQVNDR